MRSSIGGNRPFTSVKDDSGVMTGAIRARIRKPFSRTAAILKLVRAARKFAITDGRYTVRLARTNAEVRSALELRYQVFNVEIAGREAKPGEQAIDFDEYDHRCRHLVVIENSTGRTVGTYRINSIETAKRPSGFYSFGEFTIEDLPAEVLERGMEVGRACIAPEHRNTKVLFLLWKGLATYLQATGKRYLFGCCSLFTNDEAIGRAAHQQLEDGGHFMPEFRVVPKANGIEPAAEPTFDSVAVELPPLFNMYLRVGAKVCSPPMLDREFGTIDFFVVFDLEKMNPKYRKMFFGDA
ncbi:MAG: GNAT family N-acetyltransferase [Acidobacteria bacterium]|nr:GNAT family N-acetyltransferase [Acidobacteriota bacterium]